MTDSDALVARHADYAEALVGQIAATLPRHVDRAELQGFGRLGLVEAARAFDPGRGADFRTFAYYRVRGAVFDGLRKMSWLPPEARRTIQRKSAEDAVVEQFPPRRDPARGLSETADDLSLAVKRLGAVFLLSEQAGEEPELDPIDHRSADRSPELRDLIGRVRELVDSLEERERLVLQKVYFEGLTMTECAALLGVNKATVSRTHGRAIERLREQLAD